MFNTGIRLRIWGSGVRISPGAPLSPSKPTHYGAPQDSQGLVSRLMHCEANSRQTTRDGAREPPASPVSRLYGLLCAAEGQEKWPRQMGRRGRVERNVVSAQIAKARERLLTRMNGNCGAKALRATIVGNWEEPSGESRIEVVKPNMNGVRQRWQKSLNRNT